MTQRQKMLKALHEHVIPTLRQRGFTGKYPNFRITIGNRIELLVFMTDKCGGAFNIEISTIFLDCDRELSNWIAQEFETIEEATAFSTLKRFRMKGMLNGWFFYIVPDKNQVLVQKADDSLFERIACEVNRQMESAYDWWSRYDTPRKMKYAK